MAKVMLVEDDNNLREIYEARLAAEGYQTVSAHDGEEALALAVKERPDLIISDVMMPKISGFDMLDILRSTPETKNCKVIMMTALGQAEDRARADKLGADRYLVKSQVTLEDVIKVAHEVLDDTPVAPTDAQPVVATPAPSTPAPEPVMATPPAEPPVTTPVTSPAASEEPSTPTPAPEPPAAPTPTPVTPSEPATTPAPVTPPTTDTTNLSQPQANAVADAEKQIQDFIKNNPSLSQTDTPNTDAPATATTAPTVPASTSIPVDTVDTGETTADPTKPDNTTPPATPSEQNGSVPEPPSHKKLVLQPTENATQPPVDLNALLEKENAKGADGATPPAANTVIAPAAPSDDQPATPAGGNPNDISL